jgi:hypothetical protein
MNCLKITFVLYGSLQLLYNEITRLQHLMQSLLFKLIIKLSCRKKKERKTVKLKPKVEEPINIDNGKILLIITASCRTVRMLFLGNSSYSTEHSTFL